MFSAVRGKGFVCWNAKQAKYTIKTGEDHVHIATQPIPFTNAFLFLQKNTIFFLRVYGNDLWFLLLTSTLYLVYVKKKNCSACK